MHIPAAVNEIILQPGDFYFGGRDTRVRTFLGSCVSIVMWHERLRIGGMCHYLLPSRRGAAEDGLDGRYANEAMEMFMRAICAAGTRPVDYHVKIFGGGNMFPRHQKSGIGIDVPAENITAARELIDHYGLNLLAEHLGGAGHRQIIFDIGSGDIWMRRTALDRTDSVKVTP